MSNRVLYRTIHLAATPLLGAFVYAPALRDMPAFALTMQVLVFPAVALAGLAMWPGLHRVRRWLGRPART